MVVCKYFLKGACRFGNACRFDHTLYDTGTSVLLHPSAATAIQNQSQQNVDTETLVKSVRTDMLNLEKGGQWLLSAYTPFKEKPPFDGFEDKSFEEIRFGFYEANKAGKLEEFKRQWQMMLQDAIQKIRALQNPPTEVIKTLVNIYNSPAGTNSNVNNQVLVPLDGLEVIKSTLKDEGTIIPQYLLNILDLMGFTSISMISEYLDVQLVEKFAKNMPLRFPSLVNNNKSDYFGPYFQTNDRENFFLVPGHVAILTEIIKKAKELVGKKPIKVVVRRNRIRSDNIN